MSVAVGQFTTLHDGAKLDRPLPMREFAHGPSAGCAVVAGDWAWLLEGLAERRATFTPSSWVDLPSTRSEWRYEVLPHAVHETVTVSGGSSPYSYDSWYKHAPFVNDAMRDLVGAPGTSRQPLYIDPDWTPPTTLAAAVSGGWTDGKSAHRQQLSQRTIYGGSGYYPYDGGSYDVYGYTQGGAYQRRVADDVRRMFRDLRRMRRRRCVVEITTSVSDGHVLTPNQLRVQVDSNASGITYASTMDVCSLGSSILDLQQGVTVSPYSGTNITGFVPVEAEAVTRRADYTTESAQAWFAVPVTLGGAVDTSEWIAAELDAWARSALPGGVEYSTSAHIAGLNGSSYNTPPVKSYLDEAYFDLVFPSDYQIFGGAGGWQWTPSA